ncbi:hypothetical protein D3C80_1718560 [compost metagenome]
MGPLCKCNPSGKYAQRLINAMVCLGQAAGIHAADNAVCQVADLQTTKLPCRHRAETHRFADH